MEAFAHFLFFAVVIGILGLFWYRSTCLHPSEAGLQPLHKERTGGRIGIANYKGLLEVRYYDKFFVVSGWNQYVIPYDARQVKVDSWFFSKVVKVRNLNSPNMRIHVSRKASEFITQKLQQGGPPPAIRAS